MLTFTVPHGCDGAATTSVSPDAKIPAGGRRSLEGVVPGWNIKTRGRQLPQPRDVHGEKDHRRCSSSHRPAVRLPDDQLQQFPLSVAFAGEKAMPLEFRSSREGGGGGETAWIQSTRPAARTGTPALTVMLTAARVRGRPRPRLPRMIRRKLLPLITSDDDDSDNGLAGSQR